MKVTTAQKPRLSMVVKLYKNQKLVFSATKRVKSRIIELVQGSPAVQWNLGYIKVTYNAKLGYYNHANFTNIAQLKRIITELTEWSLVRESI